MEKMPLIECHIRVQRIAIRHDAQLSYPLGTKRSRARARRIPIFIIRSAPRRTVRTGENPAGCHGFLRRHMKDSALGIGALHPQPAECDGVTLRNRLEQRMVLFRIESTGNGGLNMVRRQAHFLGQPVGSSLDIVGFRQQPRSECTGVFSWRHAPCSLHETLTGGDGRETFVVLHRINLGPTTLDDQTVDSDS